MILFKRGSRGEDVKQIQLALHLYPDGIFGPQTEAAVKEFQREHKLKVDGIVGPATLLLLIPQRFKKSRRRIDEIIIHCSATPEGKDYTVDIIRGWHLARGFSDIGYHYVIYRDGTIHNGRDVDVIGAHCSGHNAHSIGICYIGGMTYDNKKAKDTRTPEQKIALNTLLSDLHKLYPKAKIYGHRDMSPDINGDGVIDEQEWMKQCPSFEAKKAYKSIFSDVW